MYIFYFSDKQLKLVACWWNYAHFPIFTLQSTVNGGKKANNCRYRQNNQKFEGIFDKLKTQRFV